MRQKDSQGCCRRKGKGPVFRPTDSAVEASPEELAGLRKQLEKIEGMLAVLFGTAYSRTAASLDARRQLADFIEQHFDSVVTRWAEAIRALFADNDRLGALQNLESDLANALIRFVGHVRDPDDIAAYVYLRRHCEHGLLSRAKPSQFNTIHIALKQVILNHLSTRFHGQHHEILRETTVAAIDERRLMVSQFYIESREQALRLSEEKYRSSVDHAPDPMYEIDPETLRVIGANAAAERLHRLIPGAAPTALVGAYFPDLVAPERGAEAASHLRKVLDRGCGQVLDLPLAGAYFDVNSALIPLGGRRFIHVILHDVTQRRGMLEELIKAERLAAAGTFAAGVAHEVNNPLASIFSLAQSLVEGEGDPMRRNMLHTILAQITRISSTLKDLTNFARPAAPERRALDLNAVVSETLRLIAYNKRFNGIALEPALDPELAPCFADPNEIQQVLINLLFNAADATQREGGSIRVTTCNVAGEHGSRVMLRVEDNGIGILREHLERIFDPFFTTKPSGSGTGLGLSLCQRIVLANHGTIRVDSEVGKGTVVTIGLPAHEVEGRGQASQLQ